MQAIKTGKTNITENELTLLLQLAIAYCKPDKPNSLVYNRCAKDYHELAAAITELYPEAAKAPALDFFIFFRDCNDPEILRMITESRESLFTELRFLIKYTYHLFWKYTGSEDPDRLKHAIANFIVTIKWN